MPHRLQHCKEVACTSGVELQLTVLCQYLSYAKVKSIQLVRLNPEVTHECTVMSCGRGGSPDGPALPVQLLVTLVA